jgi:hypothetical protein
MRELGHRCVGVLRPPGVRRPAELVATSGLGWRARLSSRTRPAPGYRRPRPGAQDRAPPKKSLPVLRTAGATFDQKSLRECSRRWRGEIRSVSKASNRAAQLPESFAGQTARLCRPHRNPQRKKAPRGAGDECRRDKSVAIHVTSEYPVGVTRCARCTGCRRQRAMNDRLGFPTPLSSPLQQASEVVLSLQHVFEPAPAGSTVPRSQMRA